MEVINPIIIAGGKQQPSPNTFCQMNTMVGSFSQKMPIARYGAIPNVSAPILYILRPGDYSLNPNGVDIGLFEQHGLVLGSFRRLYMAGNICFNGSSRYMNFCGVYDRSYNFDYIRGFYFVNEGLYERSLLLLPLEKDHVAIPLAPLYGAYGEAGILTLDQLKSAWDTYTTLNLYYLVLEE